MNARVAPLPLRRCVSGRLSMIPCPAGRVYSVTASSARLLESGCSTIGGKCGGPSRTVVQDCLNISIPCRCQAVEDLANTLPVLSPLCAVRHAGELRREVAACRYPRSINQ